MSLTTNLNKATGNSYNLIFPKLPLMDNVRDLQSLMLNIHGTVIPSITLGTSEVHYMGTKQYMDIGDVTFDNWYVNYTVDSKYENWKMLNKWLMYINNNKDNVGRPVDEYKVDASLQILNNFREEIMVIDFKGMWINMLGEVTLSFREGQSQLESSANLIYDRYEIRT